MVAASAAGFLAAGGCNGSGGVKLVPASSNQQQNVMVIDTGIDLTASDLQGRVAAVYTETCADDSSGGGSSDAASPPAVDAGPAFDTLKQEFLAQLAQPDDSCDLHTGISGKSDPLASIDQYKTRWNAMVRANQSISQAFTYAEFQTLMGPLNNEYMNFNYHGTATSSTVAHENPNVRLVLVERELGSAEALMNNFPCIQQADVDQFVDLMNDPQVYAAFVAQPAQIDAKIAAAQSQYDVGVVNESFGAASRQTLEMLQAQNCAQPINLSAYFQMLDQATNAHNASIAGPSVLTVVAAGNDGVQINSGADSLSCDLGDPKSLLVGAYNPGTLAQTSFSNYGACVDLFAPGQAIVVEYAGGWLLWADGTSFASPLTARYASMATDVPAPFAPPTARTAVLGAIQPSNQFLPVALFPQDFFYSPAQTTTDFVVPAAAVPAGKMAPQLTQHELHRVLGPLNRLRRLKGTL
ncbi:MAG TPA: S8 family serine peptidase [Polyangia bacterium]|nr:S8 family serine peptidase [Polyangia bacterium]